MILLIKFILSQRFRRPFKNALFIFGYAGSLPLNRLSSSWAELGILSSCGVLTSLVVEQGL